MILLYHKVAPEPLTQWWVSADAFDRHMAALAAYRVVLLSEYDPADPSLAVITFDGVYENVHQFALPILRKWGYPFELFVTGQYIGGDNAFDSVEPFARFCSLEQVENMVAHGGRVQWHTATHRRLQGLDAATLRSEVAVPDALRARFAPPHLRWFAYPHGDHSDDAVAAVRAQYDGALSCVAGNDRDCYQLNRVTATEGTRLQRSRVTLIVANYNYGSLLPQAMESVLAQTMAPDEIILIDDASTDGSQAVAERYRDVAHVVLNEQNLGIVGNFNKAVGLASGDYIAFLGADNRLRCDYIERCRSALDADPVLGIAYTDMVIFGHLARQLAESVAAKQIGVSVVERWPIFHWTFPEATPEALAGIGSRNFIHGSSMYRRRAFDAVGGYQMSDGPEDHHLFVRMLQAGWHARRVPWALVEYRQHSGGQANTTLGLQMEVTRLQQVDQRLDVKLLQLREQELLLESRAVELQQLQRCMKKTQQDESRVRAELTASEQLLRETQQEVKRICAELAASEERLRALLATRSWRITRPIRALGLLVRGEFGEFARRARTIVSRRLPGPLRYRLLRIHQFLAMAVRTHDEIENLRALQDIVRLRSVEVEPQTQPLPVTAADWPPIDISVVTFHSARWVDAFVASLEALDYPVQRLALRFVDNGSTDDTVAQLQTAAQRLRRRGWDASVEQRTNQGFGAGHNAGLVGGRAALMLVTNIDLVFEPDALRRAVAVARTDSSAAAWEFRQKPYEHPKFYDPVTGATNWNSHACVLLRRQAFDAVGGYDRHIFMYGEDVELSYRLRRAGWLLRYVPTAVVFHYSYEVAGQVKPLQYTGSVFANLYLRLKYGTAKQFALVPPIALWLLLQPERYQGSRMQLVRSIARLVKKAPAALAARRPSAAHFPFRGLDYDLVREGAFCEGHPLPQSSPLVSVVTRTYAGRWRFLREAMACVSRQTHQSLELVVVQDGGDSLREAAQAWAEFLGLALRFCAVEKVGRSVAGNAGLAEAKGQYCLFLDDDDLLFADHVETLVDALARDTSAVAAYTPAWEIETDYPDSNVPYAEIRHYQPPGLAQPFNGELLRAHNFMAIQSVLFRRSLYEQRGGLDTDFEALEDWVLWNVYAYKNHFVYRPKTTSMFRTPSDDTKRARRHAVLHSAYERARTRYTERIAAIDAQASEQS
jgi:GT2 family glycosyltransferase